jgi:hypothetical protein
MWEAMIIKGRHKDFDDIERFATKEEAENFLKEKFHDNTIVDEEFKLPDHFYRPFGQNFRKSMGELMKDSTSVGT